MQMRTYTSVVKRKREGNSHAQMASAIQAGITSKTQVNRSCGLMPDHAITTAQTASRIQWIGFIVSWPAADSEEDPSRSRIFRPAPARPDRLRARVATLLLPRPGAGN